MSLKPMHPAPRKPDLRTPDPIEIDAIGVVISRPENKTPNVLSFSFILTNLESPGNFFIQQGQYCIVDSAEGGGMAVGIIDQIHVDNQYFTNAQTVKNFDLAKINMAYIFPSDQWECHVANVKVLGIIPSRKGFLNSADPAEFAKIDKVGFPVTPGSQVYRLDGEKLKNFLGLDRSGLWLGSLKHYRLGVSLNMGRLFRKHLAILAQSGAGKSYLLSVLLEELLVREKGLTPAVILIDVHGEYRYLASGGSGIDTDPGGEAQHFGPVGLSPRRYGEIPGRVEHYNASFLQIGVSKLSEYDFVKFQPKISYPQMRELRKAMDMCRQKFCGKTPAAERESWGYDLKDLIFTLNDELEGSAKVRDTLVGWLRDLDRLHIFAKRESPGILELAKVGRLAILDLSGMVSMRKKQILLHYFSSRLFYARRQGTIPPTILFLEEAHNFLPESGGKHAIAKSVFETIAREGRKFYFQLVLVSQRPVHLSTTALSQCNSQIIMRITNPYDLDHIKATSEAITRESVKMISTLPTGVALVLGNAMNFPAFIQVREKMLKKAQENVSVEVICQKYVHESEGLAGNEVSPDPLKALPSDLLHYGAK